MIGLLSTLSPLALLAVVFLLGFVSGGFVGTRDNPRPRPSNDALDEHAQWPGADAGFSIHGRIE